MVLPGRSLRVRVHGSGFWIRTYGSGLGPRVKAKDI